MATPTIIIGIGSSGLYTLENVQRFYYETYKVTKPANVEYIYIETNETNRPLGTPIGNSISRVYISLDNMAEMIGNIKKQCNNPDWLPDSKVVLSAGLGAGGIRSCGRLALWGKNQQGDNFKNVIDAIKNAYTNVMHVTNNEANQAAKPTVIVTGSLTGGTGAGILIDMGYLVRHLISDIKDLYGLFLLPKEPSVINGNEVMYGNAYGAIKDLDYFNKMEATYQERWPNGFDKRFQDPPYELVQFISQDYQNGSPAISSLEGLYKMAGLFLFLNIAGIYEKRRERLVDAAGSSHIGKYGTFGLSAIQFPKDQIQEYISAELSVELLERLKNPEEYVLNNQKRPISRATIKLNMAEAWDRILKNAFESLNTVESKDLLLEIAKEVVKINKKEIKGSVVEHIISLFTSTRQDNLYALVNNNVKVAQNAIIDGIYEQVDRALQTTENLYVAKYVLEDLIDAIDKTLGFWKSMNLSSQQPNWDNELRKLATHCTTNTYKMVLEHDAVLKDRLNAIFEIMKMHLTIRMLIDIGKHVKDSKIKLMGHANELPKIQFFNELIQEVNNLIGNSVDSEKDRHSLKRRIADIVADVNDITLPILRVYPSNSFQEECKKARETYTQKAGGTFRSMRDVIDGKNVLEYLKDKLLRKFGEEIYIDFLKAYRIRVDNFQCIEDYKVANYVKANPEESVRTAKRATSPFIKLRRDKMLSPSPYLPKFVVGSNNNDLVSVIEAFRGLNYNDFVDSKDGKQELPKFENILIFYDEKGNFNPLNDLSYISLMKASFEDIPQGLEDENITKERWMQNRSAYSTPKLVQSAAPAAPPTAPTVGPPSHPPMELNVSPPDNADTVG